MLKGSTLDLLNLRSVERILDEAVSTNVFLEAELSSGKSPIVTISTTPFPSNEIMF